MALCRKGGFRAPRGAAAAAVSSHAAVIAAAASFLSRGVDGQSGAAKRLAGVAKGDWQRRGAAALKNLLAAERNRYFFRCGEATALPLFPPSTGMHASCGNRFYSRMPRTSLASAAGVKPVKRRESVEASSAHPRMLPSAFSTTAAAQSRFPSPSSSLIATSNEGTLSPNILGNARFATGVVYNDGLKQHLFNSFAKGRSFGGQQQLRGFAFPSLRFFANGGGSCTSSDTVTQSSAASSSTSSVSPQQLRLLQQQAEANLDDAQLQQRYLGALNAHGESYRAVQHVEKYKDNLQGMNEAVLIEYVKALCSSGLIHQQGRSISQVVQRYLAEGGRLNGDDVKGDATRGASASSSLTSLLQQHQTQQQQLLQQQLMVQLQQLVHQLQVEGAQRRAVSAASLNAPVGDAARAAGVAAATEGEIVKLANAATAAGRFSASAAAPLTVWRRYSPLRAIKWFCRGLWGFLKACNRGLWGLLLSPVVAVFLFWSFLNDGVQAVQNSVKNMEGSGGLGSQTGGKKASEWVAGKVVKPEEVNTSFADVKGCEEVKKEVVEVVEYLKAPAKFTAMGARLPKGVLLQGPPGTGKTLLARAIAGEAGVPFIHASGSDFEEMYVGVGASRLRQLFAEARKRSPCILFIDEIDALGGRRTLTENKHHRQTLNQLLTELDGFKPSDGVTLICATNLAEALDPALTRPGRIDRIIHVPLPCKKERIDILQHYAVKMPLAEDVDLDLLASLTSGMTGADLANLLNFAAIRAATEGKVQVTLAEVEESFDRLMVGNRRSSVVMKEEERKVTAYHESGHALMCLYTPGSLPLHKATILFRGSALGVTWSVNREESFSKSLKEYLASLDVAMGGKAAEEIVFGKGNVTSGCFNDLQKATRVARNMVTGFGMGVEDSRAPMVVSGKEYSFLSDESKKKVDEAVQRLLDQSYERARALLTEKRDELERLAQALLEHETLTADEIRAAVAGTIDSAAIKERRRQKAAGAQVPKPKVKNGDEGEGEEEQQPPSALLRSGDGRSEPITKRVDTKDSQLESQTRAVISAEKVADVSSSIPSTISNSAQSSREPSAGAQRETGSALPGDGKGIFAEATEASSTTDTPFASGASPPYSVAAPVTVSAVSALLAAASQDPSSEQHMEKQQPAQGTEGSQKTSAAEKCCAIKAEVQEENREITKVSKPTAEHLGDGVSVQSHHDTAEAKTEVVAVERATEAGENAKKPSGSHASQKGQTAGVGGEKKDDDSSAGEHDKTGGSV